MWNQVSKYSTVGYQISKYPTVGYPNIEIHNCGVSNLCEISNTQIPIGETKMNIFDIRNFTTLISYDLPCFFFIRASIKNFTLKMEQSRYVPLGFDWKIIRIQLANVPSGDISATCDLLLGILFFKTASNSLDNCACRLNRDDRPVFYFSSALSSDKHRLRTHARPSNNL